MKAPRIAVGVVSAALVILVLGGWSSCGKQNEGGNHIVPARDINLVKEAHTNELMSLKGVVGVYVGALDDGKPCIGVLVEKKTPELEKKIPKSLEGYPVKIDETGTVRPMK